MFETQRGVLIIFTLLCTLGFFITLSIRADHVAEFSNYLVFAPMGAFCLITIGIFAIVAICGFSRTLHDRLYLTALIFLTAGAAWTYALLAGKAESIVIISYTFAFLPFMAGIFTAIVFITAGTIASATTKRRKE